MATYTTLKYGSKGDEVKKLQTALGFTGKDVDGIFGDKTLSAVKNYQKNNGLTVDGIVGENTWGALNTNSATPTTSPTTPQQSSTYKYEDFTPDPFTKSDNLTNLGAQYQDKLNNPYVMQESPWLQNVDDYLKRLENREKFSYDLNGDALYQQYKDQYTTQGQMAMMDTMGQAAAMTGGYGNSYAQNVGQQAYQGYLQQLNDKVPELYQIALNQYNQEGQDLKDMLSIYNGLAKQDYAKERDKVSDHYTELGLLGDQYDRMYNEEYGLWGTMTGIAQENHANRQTAGYQEKQDDYTHAMSLLSLGIIPEPDVLAAAGISSTDAQAIVNKVEKQEKLAATVSSGGGGDDKPKALSVDDHDKIIAQLQAYNDVGDNTKLAAYLDSLVAAGTITEAYADALYDMFYVKKEGPNPAPNLAANGYKISSAYGNKVTR